MSKSYRRFVKQGICVGSNTEYYRERNRIERNKNKQALRNILANSEINEIDDKLEPINIPYDDLNEPTDGHRLITIKDKDKYPKDKILWNGENYLHYWNRKFGKYLKRKTKRNGKIYS